LVSSKELNHELCTQVVSDGESDVEADNQSLVPSDEFSYELGKSVA